MAAPAHEVLPEGLTDPDALDAYVGEQYGEKARSALRLSLRNREAALQELHQLGLNGKAQPLLNEYASRMREYDRRSAVGRRWTDRANSDATASTPDTSSAPKETSSGGGILGAIGTGAKETLKFVGNVLWMPFRALGWAFKEHPFLTTAAIGATLYFTNWGADIIGAIQNWRNRLPTGRAKELTDDIINPPVINPAPPPGVTPAPALKKIFRSG
jgi:hypothetical protein